MDNIKLYEIDAKYISYLSDYAKHLFRNKQAAQNNERKYIGVVLYKWVNPSRIKYGKT